MKKLTILVFCSASAIATTTALADDTSLINDMNMKPLSPAQSTQLRSERDVAKAQWANMTPDQKDAVKKAAREKRQSELSAMERFGQNDDMTDMTKSETAQMKAEREAAQAKWASMTPDEKNAVRKAAQQKRASDLNATERAGQNDDMNKYFSY